MIDIITVLVFALLMIPVILGPTIMGDKNICITYTLCSPVYLTIAIYRPLLGNWILWGMCVLAGVLFFYFWRKGKINKEIA